MNNNMKIPGLEDVNIEKIEQIDDRVALYISLPVKPHPCCLLHNKS